MHTASYEVFEYLTENLTKFWGVPTSQLQVLPPFWTELQHVKFLVMITIINSFSTNLNLMLIISQLKLELILSNLNFFQSFCFTLCLNLTFCLALQRKTELLKVFSWLFMKYCVAGNSNCRRRRRQKQKIFGQIPQVQPLHMKPYKVFLESD